MNKRANPFYPPPAPQAGPHQPYAAAPAAQPPPPNGQQYNYAGYWAQAQQYQQPGQWAPHPPAAPPPPAPPSAPAAPTADHAALYANYGYGPQHTWTQPAQVQPGHQPQQQSAIPIPYSAGPYAAGPPASQPPLAGVPQYAPQQPQYHPAQPAHQGYNRPPPPAPVHHPPPPNLPPAKRPRFGAPAQQPQQQQPRFHPPAPPAGPHNRNGPPQAPQQSGPGVNQTPLGGRGGGSFGSAFLHANLGGGRGGARGGNPMRGGPIGRGGMRGRGGAFGGGARLGPPLPSAPMRGAPRGPGAMNRRQRPAASGQQVYRSGPGQGRGGGPSKQASRDGDRIQPSNTNTPSKAKPANGATTRTEPQRAFTDFKICGLQILGNGWSWGTVPAKDVASNAVQDAEATPSTKTGLDELIEIEKAKSEINVRDPGHPISTNMHRFRIYFHNPMINGEAIGPGGSSPTVPLAGKRKKMDDDDDVEFESEQRARQRPPPGFALKKESSFADSGSLRDSLFGDGDSVARREMSISTSVAGTEELEEDWLMAAIADGSGAAEQDGSEHIDPSIIAAMETGDSTAPHAPTTAVDGSAIVDPSDVAPADVSNAAAEQSDGQPGHSSNDGLADNSLISSLYLAPPTHDTAVADVDAAQTAVSASAPISSLPQSSGSPSASVAPPTGPSDNGVDAAAESAALVETETTRDDAAVVEGTEDDVPAEFAQDAGSMFSPSSHLDDHASALDDASVAGADVSTTAGDQSMQVVDDSTIGWSRISITYAFGKRRLVLDSAIVQKMTIHRAEGRIDVDLKVEKFADGHNIKGILLEQLTSAATQEFTPVPLVATSNDILTPPFATFESPSNVTLVAYLDREKPLSAPKWVKNGDLAEYLRCALGKTAVVSGENSWFGRIEVADPDAPRSIHTVLDAWARSSSAGTQADRLAFVDAHMKNVRNILEIVLRIVRSDRAAFNPRTDLQAAPLVAALPHGSGLASHQTHVTLALLAIYKLAEDHAMATGTLASLTSHIGEIVRCLPQHLIQKSLDAIFKDSRSSTGASTSNGKKQGK